MSYIVRYSHRLSRSISDQGFSGFKNILRNQIQTKRTLHSNYNKKCHQSQLFLKNHLKASVLFGLSAGCLVTLIATGKFKGKQSSSIAFCEEKSSHLKPIDGTTVDRNDDKRSEISLQNAVKMSNDLLQRIKDEVGTPGLVVAVTIDGEEVLNTGIGYADIENRVACTENTMMRIASISKPIAMATVAKLWEDKKLDIDKPISKYIKDWPEKTFENEKVEITTRQLVSHLGGIRHYEKHCGKKNREDIKSIEKEGAAKKKIEKESVQKKPEQASSEFDNKEYYLTKKCKSVSDALLMFKDDDLCSKPGSEFLYTTHGWTVVSAVVEGASGKKFPDVSRQLFRELGMTSTHLDENEPIIYHRSRYYVKSKTGRLKNTPYVDNSYKWAGGGFISTAGDLVKFGNAMLYSYQQSKDLQPALPGYLKPSTVRALWSPVAKTDIKWDKDGGYYGMGWGVMPKISEYGHGRRRDFYVSHTGFAVGASSVLLVVPKCEQGKLGNQSRKDDNQISKKLPQGISVAIIVNLQGVNLNSVALEIAKLFDKADTKQ